MKIRNGFVSNSSSSSFTIYGWSEKILSKHISESLPAFVGVRLEIDEDVFCENIEKLWDGREWDIISFRDRDGYNIFGVGSACDEADHYVGNWHEGFRYDEPDDEKKKQLEEIGKKLGLPEPQIYSDTYYA